EAYVNVHGEYTVEEIANLGELIYPFVPRPPALSALPEPPEKRKDDTKKDAGTGEGKRDAEKKDK
ncbi:MAG: hypothetical protein ABEN55_05245, partial [Bradymonadaceae bacterium]